MPFSLGSRTGRKRSTLNVIGRYLLNLRFTANTDIVFPTTGTLLSSSIADQVITGGGNITPLDLGTKSSGTLTVDLGACPFQKVTGNGAFTLACSNGGSTILKLTNGASAGAVTFSGFAMKSGSTGDALTTTNTNVFWIMLWGDGSVYGYCVLAGQ